MNRIFFLSPARSSGPRAELIFKRNDEVHFGFNTSTLAIETKMSLKETYGR